MTGATSWMRVKEVFQAALERDEENRRTFLEHACAEDRVLRREVESLLAAHKEAGAFGERPAFATLAESAQGTVEYQILSRIGAGGMGEVFRARDVTLGREVAIKILPPIFAVDPARLARFDREAHVLASLNHPNICAIYGLTDVNGTPGLVLELVAGQTLAERLAGGRRLRLREALTVARDVARALEAAHEQGIIHRDLKPANIKITPSGTVKVLDFGLAKAPIDASMETNPRDTQSMRASESGAGVLLGTAAYMSPEQARGDSIDKRTDIWSFGCVLYELLTGQRAVPGATVSETITAVSESGPAWTAIPAAVPENIQRLVRRCLEKDQKRRLRDIGDAAFELDDAVTSSTDAASLDARANDPVSRRLPFLLFAAALAVIVSGSLWMLRDRPGEPAPEMRRVSVEWGTDASLVTFQYGQGSAVVLSPDGTTLAFVAQAREGAARQIYVRRLYELRAVPISGTDGALNPFFSPDGRWIAFFADGKLKKVPTSGGGAMIICTARNNRGGAWGENDIIVFAPDRAAAALLQVPAAGGEPTPLTTLGKDETTQRWPQLLRRGGAVLFTGHNRPDGFEDANVVIQSLPDGPRKVLVRGAYYGRYLASGHLLYVHDGKVFAVPFDLDRLEIDGPAAPVLDAVTVAMPVGAAELAFSDNGTVAYLPTPEHIDYMHAPIDWMDRNGATKPLRTAAERWLHPRFAGNGRQLAFSLFDGTQHDVWLYDWPRDELTRLTFDRAGDIIPVWTPDSRRVVFQSVRHDGRVGNLYWQRSDGVGEAQRLTNGNSNQVPGSWHPNAKILAFSEVDAQTGLTSILMLTLEGDEVTGWRPGEPTLFLKDADKPMFSPDGRWLAYTAQSPSVARTEVFVKPFSEPGGPWQISTDGGTDPAWSAKRAELFYASPANRIMVSSYSARGVAFRANKPRVLPDSHFAPRVVGRSFDVHPDGERFALAKASHVDTSRNHVTLVFNFLDELRRLVR